MSSPVIIQAQQISKAYQLGEVGTGTLSRDIERWWAKLRGKEDPFLKIGEVNDRTNKGNSDVVWSLKDISFDIEQGDAVGIIGRNGAGKSTLLKILSRITTPTSGQIKIKGRIASLLEVGTGFHPELTGRENIYLNGAILGMRRKEIARKFDEIVAFAGIERYVDTPVKRYSSGMYVRLAFAVAAHLENEILLIDEVLAVGDAEFQKKCLGKMGEVSKGEGRTVLFVSHNMTSVKTLCNKGIVLNKGQIEFTGTALNAVLKYQQVESASTQYLAPENLSEALGNQHIKIKSFQVTPLKGELITLSSGIKFTLNFLCNIEAINLDVTFEMSTLDDVIVFHNGVTVTQQQNSKKGYYTIIGTIDPYILNSGIYKFKLIFGQDQRIALFVQEHIVQFEIMNELKGNNANQLPGITFMPGRYQLIEGEC